MRTAKKTKVLPLPRVRYEPPTVEEAIAAARDLSEELDSQIEIAAALMGLPEEEVRPLVSRPAPRRTIGLTGGTVTSLNLGRRVVVVERKGARVPLRQARL